MTTRSWVLRSASALFVLSLSAAAASGCGGTNSETPWPVEPEDVDLGPEGEARGNEQLGAPPASARPAGGKPAPKPVAEPREESPREAPREAPQGPEPSAPSNPSTQF